MFCCLTASTARALPRMADAEFGFEYLDYSMWQFLKLVIGIGWLVACLTSQQHASVSEGRICSDNCTCCHTEIEVADQTVIGGFPGQSGCLPSFIRLQFQPMK